MNDNILKEYIILRNEIDKKIELHNSWLTFGITTVVAILTFALTQKEAKIYLLTFCILIPLSMRILYYQIAMVKISSYMIVFLEKDIDGINWETRNAQYLCSAEKIMVKSLRYYELVVLGAVSYILYVETIFDRLSSSFWSMLKLIFPLVLVVWLFLIVRQINNIDKLRDKWVKNWKRIAKLESGDVSTQHL